jgi:ATP-dependent DNA helicase DinG
MPLSDPGAILGPDGAIARRLRGYEARGEQVAMARAVAGAIDAGGPLLVEAGTGVGKSFAYLVPAILATAEAGTKVVISTGTINLQEQLLRKDIPFLRAVMPQEFSAVLVKGRGNYVSLRRLRAAQARAGTILPRVEDIEQLGNIALWAGRTEDGSRSDLDFAPSPGVWEAVGSENDNCLGRKCPNHSECFYFKARRRMASANILVVNHALYLSDLALRSAGAGFLPEHDVAIFDEAHTLEHVASEHLGLRVTDRQVDYLLAKLFHERTRKGLLVYHELVDAIRQVQTTRTVAEDFFAAVREYKERHGTSNGRLRRPMPLTNVLGAELRRLSAAIARGAEGIDAEDQRIELTAAQGRCEGLADALETWLDQTEEGAVHWIETEFGARSKVTLASAPLDVGPTLRAHLFQKVRTCVLTSATLCVGGTKGGFTFTKSRLGLTKSETVALGSPFDYPNQATVHIPRDLPDPSTANADFERASIGAIRHYLEKTHGKALVLFTSHRHLKQAAAELAPWLASRNIALYSQGDGTPRTKLVEAFREDTDSVLFGSESFWQGVDVPGETLSNVIIVRLPFRVPDHPLLEARLEAIQRRGGNKFLEYQVPEAIIRLKQGFGRLIRSKADRGIVVLLDPRVLTKPYGRQFLDALPECPRVVEVLGPSGRGPASR